MIDWRRRTAARRAAGWLAVLGLGWTGCDRGGAGEEAPAAGGAVAAGTPAPAGGPPEPVDIEQLGYARGQAEAPVTVYEFADFGCGYCAKFAAETYPELHREFVETGRVRWVYVPFVMGMFPNGEEAARAAVCAGEQERFWPMHDALYTGQREWKASGEPARLFASYAARLGLDRQRFAACYEENHPAPRLELSNRAADAAGIRATPTFIVGGRLVEGALPAAQFRQILQMVSGG